MGERSIGAGNPDRMPRTPGEALSGNLNREEETRPAIGTPGGLTERE